MYKYTLLLLVSSVASVSAQEKAPAAAPAPAPVAVAPATPAADTLPEVRAYQIELAATAFDGLAELAEQGKMQDPVAQMTMFIQIQDKVSADKLPAYCQEYIKATRPVSDAILGKIKEAQAKGATEQELIQIMMGAQGDIQKVNAAHPEAAKIMSADTAMNKFMKELNLEAGVQASTLQKMKDAGPNADPAKIMGEVFRETAAKLRAAK